MRGREICDEGGPTTEPRSRLTLEGRDGGLLAQCRAYPSAHA